MATFPTNPAATALVGDEIVPLTQGAVDKRTTAQGIADLFRGTTSTPITSATPALSAATGNLVSITGTTTITALGTVDAGAEFTLVFADVLILTHDATSLILPTGANITTAGGDVAVVVSLGAGNWRCVGYERASGAALAGGSSAWGAITGTLSAQTDLQTALDAKLDDSQASAFGLSLLDDADATAARTTLGLGTAATTAAADYATAAQGTTADTAVQPADAVTTLNMATARLLGRSTAAAGAVEEITLGTNLSFTGATLNAAGGGGSPGGATTQVQFNDAAAFAGDAAFTFNNTTKALAVNIAETGKGTDIARAATTNIWAATGNFVHLTGTTTVTSFGANTAGNWRLIRFAGAGTLTHNATSMILPGAANITTAANDTAIVVGEGGSNARVVAYERASGAALVGGGGVTGWTASTNTASPNNIDNAARFLAATASANGDAVIQPKGTGALLAQLPDSTTTGGDKRGVNAVDLQQSRTSATEVASGIRSAISGGRNNTASAQETTVCGGFANTASGTIAVVSGGQQNTASGGQSSIGGGDSNIASGSGATVAGGFNNNADGQYSMAIGFKAQARGIIGAIARCAGGFNNFNGDGQDRQFYLSQNTSNATQATATANRGAAGTDNQIVLPNGAAFIVKGTINVREDATGDSSAWDFTAYIKRGVGVATTAMVAACTPTLIAQDAGAATWVVAVDADTTNGSLRCRVTGQASHTLAWGWSIYSCNEVVG